MQSIEYTPSPAQALQLIAGFIAYDDRCCSVVLATADTFEDAAAQVRAAWPESVILPATVAALEAARTELAGGDGVELAQYTPAQWIEPLVCTQEEAGRLNTPRHFFGLDFAAKDAVKARFPGVRWDKVARAWYAEDAATADAAWSYAQSLAKKGVK